MNATDSVNPSANPAGQRDDKGRFIKGNLGGPGNPFARQCARARQVVHEAVSEEELRTIIEAVKKKALEGDVPSAKLILSYVVGRPAAAVDPETLDQHELNKYLTDHLPPDINAAACGKVNGGMPTELLLKLFRVLVPELIRQKGHTAMDIIKNGPPQPADPEDDFDDDDDEEEADEIRPSAPPTPPSSVTPPADRRSSADPDLLDRLRGQIKRPVADAKPARPMTNGSNGNGHPANRPMTNGVKGKSGRKKNKKKKRAAVR